MIDRVARAVSVVDGLQLFIKISDEVIFLLDTKNPEEADRVARKVAESIGNAFNTPYMGLASLFRVESFLALELPKAVRASGGVGASLSLRRRLIKPGCWETFLNLCGVSRDTAEENVSAISDCLRALREERTEEWAAWLKA